MSSRVTRVPKCSKCHHLPAVCVDLVRCTTEFVVRDDGTLEDEGYHDVDGTIGMEAHCSCGHTYRLRIDRALRLLYEKQRIQ
jgi:hypothetical protein